MERSKSPRLAAVTLLVCFVAGCAVYAAHHLDKSYGTSTPQERLVPVDSIQATIYRDQVQPILENRCVVCHGCYDAPCQLKLSSPAGIDRGASKSLVYSGSRPRAIPTTRLFVDHTSTAEWRDGGFYPVLNERNQEPTTNQQASVMSRLLTLKQKHPLPPGDILPDSFDVSLNRDQECPKLEELDGFEQTRPEWGMPYGLPALEQSEHSQLQDWLAAGANMSPALMLGDDYAAQVADWEQFLNGSSLKQQLVSHYLYEHWFLAHLYFSDLPPGEFFKVVRSRTPPGDAIDIIATRRPYDDPHTERVYYRLWREQATILAKTHMPYALNNARLEQYTQLFIGADYEVKQLPSYKPEIASNPFKTFEAIPVTSRYQFLLEEAQFTIMNFIKGPVCRGQVALNVIDDHFWVFFAAPQEQPYEHEYAFYTEQQENLELPSAARSNALILSTWFKYSVMQRKYLHAKATRMNELFADGEHLSLDGVWDGNSHNQNAALTVFRHFNSASIIKGMVGKPPQTAWIIDFGILERIHYLLVAGFDVYGNVGHQLNSRLYMDFLRMEAEFNFLALLPPKDRISELTSWYQGVSDRQKKHIQTPYKLFDQPSGITYSTNQPKQELFDLLRQNLSAVLPDTHSLYSDQVPASHRLALSQLEDIEGGAATLLPQVTFLTVNGIDASGLGASWQYTLLHNNVHSNITSLLNESETRLPEKDTITVINGFVGAYPEAFIQVDETQLDDYVDQFLAVHNESEYQQLMGTFGIRRTNAKFWQHSDGLHERYMSSNPYRGGLFDYNRLQNR